MKNVCLVLGSGGARGMAHIGVIEELQRQGYHIKQVVGCSMGAVVGGIYCSGYLTEYKHWLISLTKLEVFRLLDFTLSSQGFVKGDRVFKAIQKLIGDHSIENFNIPFTAVAADIIRREEVHYNSGSLFKALRASIAMPTIFTPVIDGKSQLVDGGVLNPLPLNLVSKKDGDIVVAVNLNSGIGANENCIAEPINREKAAFSKMLKTFQSQVLKKQVKAEEVIERFGFFDLMTKSFDMTQDRLTELMISVYRPDIVVEISRDCCGVFEFYRANEIIEEGRRAFKEASEKTSIRPGSIHKYASSFRIMPPTSL
jgi:NTE family protein